MSAARPASRRVLAAIGIGGLLAGIVPPALAAPTPGSAGTDTALPATSSKVTVSGRGPFSNLKVTVNQTKSLVNQAVSITWTGAAPTQTGPSRFAGNYLQIMQCWGDDDASVASNPGPPPEQCVQGAADGVPSPRDSGVFPDGSFARKRIISQKGLWPGFDVANGHVDEKTGFLWKPFRAVDGELTDVQEDFDFNPQLGAGDYWLNTSFNFVTTNEVAGARTGKNGEGSELFQLNTGKESSGLGCGQAVQPVSGAAAKVPKCWLVIVPRGGAEAENVGSPHLVSRGVMTSPLSPGAWQNRIAIPLEFNSVDSPCSLADDQRRIVGTELAGAAVSSWQPKLCSTPGLPPYAYGLASDAAARQQLIGGSAGAPGMIVVSRPYDPAKLDAAKPITYAPLSLSALVIGFNVERNPNPTTGGAASEALRGVRVADLNLTPRLVAKLLTQSYRSQVAIKASLPPKYDWARNNPPHLGLDPDFLQFNEEFTLLENGGKNFGGLVLSSRNSDAARQVWEWVLSDPEARAWLDGARDPFGMAVNPVYATTAKANSVGAAFADPLPDSFPKSDPYCYQAPALGSKAVVPPLLCGNDWLPYTQGMSDAARLTRAADDGARTSENAFAPSPGEVYKRDGPQTLGSRTILSLTDSPSAAQYGVQTARLSRAGDNGPVRVFIAPVAESLTAGVESMAPRAEPAVREPAPNAAAPTAYPLTALTYAAVSPLSLDEKARREYAAFVDYAAGPGQVAGLERGQLPRGFAHLPASLQAQAAAAAKTIRELKPPPANVEPEPINPAPVSTAAAGAGGGTATPAPQPSSFGSPATGTGQASTASSSPRSGGAESATAPPATPPVTALAVATAPRAETPLARALTPVVALAKSRFVLPGLLGIALLSALGAIEITRRPRYAAGDGDADIPVSRVPGLISKRAAGLRNVTSRWPVKR